jgi:hypothetical protein
MLNLIININSLELFSIDGIILLQVKVSHRRSCQPDLLLFMIKEHILHRSVDYCRRALHATSYHGACIQHLQEVHYSDFPTRLLISLIRCQMNKKK